jgi:hypothetical protein
MHGKAAERRVERDLAGEVRRVIVVGAKARAARNLRDGLGVLERDRPARGCGESSNGERVGPADLRLPIEDLPGRSAEVERLRRRIGIHEVRPRLPCEKTAEREVRVPQAQAVRIADALVAVGAVEVDLDVRVEIAEGRRRIALREQPRLAGAALYVSCRRARARRVMARGLRNRPEARVTRPCRRGRGSAA